ncbi:MAG TPA: hypothetical protein VGF77_12405 [Allosphingosinicella sp.]|jgi:hypothetical protein
MIQFHDSWGRSRTDIDPAAIVAALAAGGPDFWQGPTGQSALSVSDEDGTRWLFLTPAEPHSFFLYGQLDDGRRIHLAGSPDRTGEEMVLHIGGTPVTVPGRFLTPAAEAARVAGHFLETGHFAPDAAWRLDGAPFKPRPFPPS